MEEFNRHPTEKEVLFAKQNGVPSAVDNARYGSADVQQMQEAVHVSHRPKSKGKATRSTRKGSKSKPRSDSAEDDSGEEAEATSGESDSEDDDDAGSGDEASATSGEESGSRTEDEYDGGADSEEDGSARGSDDEDSEDAEENQQPFSGSKSGSADT